MKLRERLSLYEKLMRLDKPIGILLLLWPTLWAVWIASNGEPNWMVVWIFVLGTVLMRSAGCVINDYADRNLDPLVARTKDRPLAANRVSTREALALAAGLSLAAFLLIIRFNKLTWGLAVIALFLAASYPFTKRFLAIPQAYLGIAFGFGIPMAFAAITAAVPAVAWVLLLANIFWAIAYDTQYAMVDREDDRKIGIHSSALLFGRYDVVAVVASHMIALALLVAVGVMLKFGIFYFAGLIAAAWFVGFQYHLIKRRDTAQCFEAFLNNKWLGGMIFVGIVAHYYVSGIFEKSP